MENLVTRNWIVNGEACEVVAPPLKRVLDVLREDLKLMGSKEGCGEGECGACTILLDGAPVVSCLLAVGSVPDGSNLMTVEGLENTEGGRIIQQAYLDLGAAQCGFCIPGMLMASYALLCAERNLGETRIREAHAGNLCRCTGYDKIVKAVQAAAAKWPETPA